MSKDRAMRETIRMRRLILLAVLGALELARARLLLLTIKPSDVLARNVQAAQAELPSRTQQRTERDHRLCREIPFAITAMARRVPWRSDCLVQALAGQSWLRRQHIASEIVVGTALGESDDFESHAWLARGGKVLLGGDPERFQTILNSNA